MHLTVVGMAEEQGLSLTEPDGLLKLLNETVIGVVVKATASKVGPGDRPLLGSVPQQHQ